MSEWIKSSEHLPLYKEVVLGYLDNGIMTEVVYRGEYNNNRHIFRIELTGEDTATRVLFWQPLPSPPEDVE